MTTFEQLVNDAIGLNIQSRLRNADAEVTYDPIRYNKELATIHINAGRHTGKTKYILDYATSGDLIVVPMENMRRVMLNQGRVRGKELNILWGRDENMFSFFTGKKYDFRTIYVDEPNLFRKYGFSFGQLYLHTAKDYKQLYVLLGE